MQSVAEPDCKPGTFVPWSGS